jgi:signal transduction histidine kinase
MKDANLYISLIYFISVSGIFANVLIDRFHRPNSKVENFWFFSVFYGVVSTLSYFLASVISPFFVLIANTFLFASIITISLLFVSWHRKVKSIEIRASIIASVIFAMTIGFLLTDHGNYILRSFFVTISILILLIFNLYGLYKAKQKDSSIQLKLISHLNASLIIVAIIRLYATYNLGQSVDYYYNEGNQLLACRVIFFSGLLLLYVFISNFYYQHTLDAQKLLLTQIEMRDLKLNISTSENKELSGLIAERERMLSLLSSSNKLISTSAISASIAHEINQPLAAIKLNAELLKLNISNNKSKLSTLKLIDRILDDGDRINLVIKSLRNLFLDRAKKMSKVNMGNLITSSIDFYRNNLIKAKINLNLNLMSKGLVLIEPGEFNHAFINIINNAVNELSYIREAKKMIKISTYDTKDSFYLKIADNGRGIPTSLKGNIFELFKSGRKEGMGLGLWLTKYIILRYKGKISFRNLPKAGVEFVIEFPLVKR